jgi:ubiquinone/menaquinone biosynthesis C-methylase UbiE
LIKRTSKQHIEKILSSNPQWKILDIGCGYSANNYANVICDVQDFSKYYKDKKFVRLENKILPFSNKEFDFVISSHVMEHVNDVEFFISEIERISSKGYIELPTKLEDNLVFENKKDHLWHMDFDDVDQKLIITNKLQHLEPILTVSTIKKLEQIFKKSLVIELIWEDKINYVFNKIDNKNFEKISLFTLVRKYFSKKIRMFFK